MITSDLSRPASGPTTHAEPRPTDLPGRDLLIRLGRAVQRARIYPPDHPAVWGTTAPFYEAAAEQLRRHPQVIVGVTRERLLVGTGDAPPVEHESFWLSRRLSARGIASIALRPCLTPAEAVRLVTWLAADGELEPGVPAPQFDGAVVSAVDFANVRFREVASEVDESQEAAVVWQSMSQALVGEWHDLLDDLPPLPADVARRAVEAIDDHEGTGLQGLASRLFGLSAEVAALPPVVQGAVKQRLGEFVAALSPELRGQLLRVVSGDAPGKIEMLSHLVDRLPRAQVLEVIHNLEITRGGSTHKFLDFMVKLVSLTTSDSVLAEAMGERCEQQGMPAGLAHLDAPEVRRVLEEMFAAPREALGEVSPQEYEARLEALTCAPAGIPHQYDAGRQVDPQDDDAVLMQAGLIATRVLDGGSASDKVASLTRLELELPRFLAARHFDALAQIYEATQRLFESGQAVEDAVSARAGAVEEFFRKPEIVSVIVDAYVRHDNPVGTPLQALAQAAGPRLVEAALRMIIGTRTPGVRERLSALVQVLDLQAVVSAVAGIYRGEPRTARALLSALSVNEGDVPVDIAAIFLNDVDPGVRLDACRWLLASPLMPAQLEALLRRALSDESPRVVELALSEIEKRNPMPGVRALGDFLAGASTGSRERQQQRAVGLLSRCGDAEAGSVLASALDTRHRRFDRPSRRVSLAMAAALDGFDNGAARASARSFRRSPAGLLGRLAGDARRGAS